jgi:hypothetical protein
MMDFLRGTPEQVRLFAARDLLAEKLQVDVKIYEPIEISVDGDITAQMLHDICVAEDAKG